MYIGDTEINSFAEVGEIEKFADDYSVIKEDCIGHTQKRMWQHSRFTKVRTVVRKHIFDKLSSDTPLHVARVNSTKSERVTQQHYMTTVSNASFLWYT